MILTQPKQPIEMRIVHINEKYKAQQNEMSAIVHSKLEKKALDKQRDEAQKQRELHNKRLFIIDFKGDIQASDVSILREEISAVLSLARKEQDSVILRLESPGGMVHGYGLAASQLARIRDAGLHLTISVDKVAASGGYMMACIAHQIIAAPFAIMGSIGVVAQVPNFNKLLKKLDVDFEVYTAGQYKRTVTMFGENTPAGVDKFKQELEQTHQLFKTFVAKYRNQLDIEQVTTGEHWYGEDALKLQLVDRLATSDEVILEYLNTHDVYAIYSRSKPTVIEKLGLQAMQVLNTSMPALSNTIVNIASDLHQLVRKHHQ